MNNHKQVKNETITTKSKGYRYLTLSLKFFGILLILGIILLFAFLPNYLHNKSNQVNHTNNDPTNAKLPHH